ncbi:hypothetical protein EOA35_28635, partial [Mesorhizobium sp. M8A.F.Ca.ET.023.01.1.1]
LQLVDQEFDRVGGSHRRQDLQKIFVLRRILAPMGTTDAIEFLIDKLKQTKTNGDFFDSMNT